MGILMKQKEDFGAIWGCRSFGNLALLGGLLGSSLLVLTPSDVHAQAKQALQGRLEQARIVTDAAGKETLSKADAVRPGDLLQYTVSYKNVSAAAVGNVALTLPIPAGLNYLPQARLAIPAQASLDGTTFQALPIKRSVRLADGKTVEQVVPASEYRALRWQVGQLEAGKEVQVSARAQVQNLTVAAK